MGKTSFFTPHLFASVRLFSLPLGSAAISVTKESSQHGTPE